jgi:hypothetical protein
MLKVIILLRSIRCSINQLKGKYYTEEYQSAKGRVMPDAGWESDTGAQSRGIGYKGGSAWANCR